MVKGKRKRAHTQSFKNDDISTSYMVSSNSISSSSGGLSIGSPKDKFVDFYFNQFGCFTEVIRNSNGDDQLDMAIAALLSICPDIEKRESLFYEYTKAKDEYGVRSASVKLAGNFMSYISDTLEFTEKSYASVF